MKADGLGVRGIGGSVDDDGLGGGGDLGGGWFGEIGEKDVLPDSGSGGGGDVLDVEDAVFELFVEDAWLDLKGGLRGFEGLAEGDESGGGAGREVERVEEAEGEGDGGDD